jgi:hypothetical protein
LDDRIQPACRHDERKQPSKIGNQGGCLVGKIKENIMKNLLTALILAIALAGVALAPIFVERKVGGENRRGRIQSGGECFRDDRRSQATASD